MLMFIWVVLCVVAGSVLLLPFALWEHEIYKRYTGSRLVACPENQQPAAVSIDALHAATTGLNGNPDLRVSRCTRWPECSTCNRSCISQAIHAQPYTPGEVKVQAKQIYHLPVLLAAFAAWYLGLIWHAQYLFRPQWLHAVGFTHAHVQPEQIAWLNLVHLLTATVCLLFAYGVAWLLAVRHRKGVLQGILVSVLLCGVVVAMNWYGIARLPHEVLVIEASYVVLATLTVGALVGGLYDKLVVPSQGP